MYYRNVSNRVFKYLKELDMHSYLVEAYIGVKKPWQPGSQGPEYFMTIVLNQHVPKEVKTRISKFVLDQLGGGIYGGESIEDIRVRRNYYHEPSSFQGGKDDEY